MSAATGRGVPPGLLVEGTAAELARVFPALVPLQPVGFESGGLVCAPRADPEAALAALDTAPLPVTPLAEVPSWPRIPARMAGGWYVRSEAHAEAPAGQPSLVLADGDAFGASDHETTQLALAALPRLPDGAALDAGCGAGLLALAWAALGKGPVAGVDADRGAITQATASARLTMLASRVEFARSEIAQLDLDDIEGRVLLANLPPPGHHALLEHAVRPPAVVLSGLARTNARRLARAWTARGLRPVAAARRGRWELWVLRG